jgi:hypothetical protein
LVTIVECQYPEKLIFFGIAMLGKFREIREIVNLVTVVESQDPEMRIEDFQGWTSNRQTVRRRGRPLT